MSSSHPQGRSPGDLWLRPARAAETARDVSAWALGARHRGDGRSEAEESGLREFRGECGGRSWRWLVAAGVTMAAFAVPRRCAGMGAGVADSGRGRALGGRVRARRGGGRTRRPVGPGLRRLRRHPAPTPTGGGHRVRHAGGRGARQREGEHHNRRSGRACRTPSAGALPAPQGNPMPAPPLVPGSVTAPGERAVVLGDGTEGDIDTGDQPGGTQAMTGRRRRKTYPCRARKPPSCHRTQPSPQETGRSRSIPGAGPSTESRTPETTRRSWGALRS